MSRVNKPKVWFYSAIIQFHTEKSDTLTPQSLTYSAIIQFHTENSDTLTLQSLTYSAIIRLYTENSDTLTPQSLTYSAIIRLYTENSDPLALETLMATICTTKFNTKILRPVQTLYFCDQYCSQSIHQLFPYTALNERGLRAFAKIKKSDY